MSDPFARMHQSLFTRLGVEALLRTTEECKVSVEHGVAVTGEYGEVTGYRTVIDIMYAGLTRPKVGDSLLIVGGSTYKLDAPLKDDGYSARWVVL